MKLTVTCELSEEDVERIRSEYEPGLTDAELVEEAVREYARKIGHDQAYRDVIAPAAGSTSTPSRSRRSRTPTTPPHPPPPAAPAKRFPDPAELDRQAIEAEAAAAERGAARAA